MLRVIASPSISLASRTNQFWNGTLTIKRMASATSIAIRWGASGDDIMSKDQKSNTVASRLLQENHEDHHIFYNAAGFHNHIAHHLLTLVALQASSDELTKAYELNKSYQRRSQQTRSSIIDDLHDSKKFCSHLSRGKHYADFLKFFQAEIDNNGWENVLDKYLFAGDQRAEAMLVRLYSGLVHPLIHLGFGVEFQQPAIIAEALAETACTIDSVGRFLVTVERRAHARQTESANRPKSIATLLDQIQADPILSAASQPDPTTAFEHLTTIASQFTLPETASSSTLAQATAEMLSAATHFTVASALSLSTHQQSPTTPTFDFYFLHHVTSAIFFSAAFLPRLTHITSHHKARLLEWKVRVDLAMYASRRAPPLAGGMDAVRSYQPRQPSGWEGVFRRTNKLGDDGHAAKFVRALECGERICGEFERDEERFRVRAKDWLMIAHMVVDSQEEGKGWSYSAARDGAWSGGAARAEL